MRSAQEDLALVARCKRELPRRHDAFEELVRAYQDKIYTMCYRLSGDASEAEDLLQEVLLRLFLRIGTFDGRSSFSTWLFRVVHNLCFNALAKRKRHQKRHDELAVEPADPRTLPGAREGRAQHALNQLSHDDRSVLVMKYLLELEVQQIAEILKLSPSAVKMRLLRAREHFREQFREAR